MILLLDNFDSFTYNLLDYLKQLNVDCFVRRNDENLREIIKCKVTGLVISPGTGTPSQSGILMDIIDYYYDKVPILGICLGHQAVGEYFGGELRKALKPMHGKLSTLTLLEDCIFKNLPRSIEVVRYNSLVIDLQEGSCLEPLAYDQNDELMGLRHNNLPIWGLQYHPEAALTEYGLTTLKNWLECNDLSS